jgi:glycine/D-amino acid oxidase-like deaminating enzyme
VHHPSSLWHDQISPDLTPREPLTSHDTQVSWDVVIAGAGFTGLWTALGVLKNNPDAKVLVVDKYFAGFGASGRNGGWVSALFPTETAGLVRRHGLDKALAMRREMIGAVDAVGEWAKKLDIDCGYIKAGTTVLARKPIEVRLAKESIAEAEKFGVDSLTWREPDETLNSPGVLGATFTPNTAGVHPAKLVRGLARAVEDMGGVVREHTTVEKISPRQVTTDRGVVRGHAVVDALEAYRATVSGRKRITLPLYSLMIATEPLPDSVWDDIGLAPGETFSDYRRLIIYGQRTADNRFAFGGRGAPYHFGSTIKHSYDTVDRVHASLAETLNDLFPQMGKPAITHRWGGPLGVPRDWHARVVYDPPTGMAIAGGYVGDGVGLSQVAGFTLADLITGTASHRVELPLVDTRWPKWEPEPLRYLGSMAGIIGTSMADAREAKTNKPSLVGKIVDSLTGH